jgi:hypothetical protein
MERAKERDREERESEERERVCVCVCVGERERVLGVPLQVFIQNSVVRSSASQTSNVVHCCINHRVICVRNFVCDDSCDDSCDDLCVMIRVLSA